jgi:hypothetical protein
MPFDAMPTCSIRRATAADADAINEWIWRDSGKRLPVLDQWLSDRLNVALLKGEGGALFMWRGPGIYEAHLFFAHRGREALNLIHEMLGWMKANMGAEQFWAAIPYDDTKQSRKVRMFARLTGWKEKGLAVLPHGLCQLFTGE